MTRQYKTDKTTYLVREIPVALWKRFKISSVINGDDSINETFLHLIQDAVNNLPVDIK